MGNKISAWKVFLIVVIILLISPIIILLIPLGIPIIVIVILLILPIFLIINLVNDKPKNEPKNEHNNEEKTGNYLMIQSIGGCQDSETNCEQFVMQYDGSKNTEILDVSVPCGIPGGQESISTFYYDNKIMFVLLGNNCNYLGKNYKKGDVLRIPYGETLCSSTKDIARKCNVNKINGLSTYNYTKDDKLNQTIVFDYTNGQNQLYKINFPSKNNKYLSVQIYNEATNTVTNSNNMSIDLEGDLSSSMSSDSNRFFFTIWNDTSSIIITFNRNLGSNPFTNKTICVNELYTASFPNLNDDVYKQYFYVLKAEVDNQCDQRCYTIRLYNPTTQKFVNKDIFERYLKLDNFIPNQMLDYPIYQIYGTGKILYFPHSKYIYEVDITSCYTVYLPSKNITDLLTIPSFNDSGSLCIFDEKLYSIASTDGEELSYWEINEDDPIKSNWVIELENPYGSALSMNIMSSDILQGIIIPKPYSNLYFGCQEQSLAYGKNIKKDKVVRKSFKKFG